MIVELYTHALAYTNIYIHVDVCVCTHTQKNYPGSSTLPYQTRHHISPEVQKQPYHFIFFKSQLTSLQFTLSWTNQKVLYKQNSDSSV